MEDPWKEIDQDILAEAIKQSSQTTREELADNLRLII